jgi:hypothetical protein
MTNESCNCAGVSFNITEDAIRYLEKSIIICVIFVSIDNLNVRNTLAMKLIILILICVIFMFIVSEHSHLFALFMYLYIISYVFRSRIQGHKINEIHLLRSGPRIT